MRTVRKTYGMLEVVQRPRVSVAQRSTRWTQEYMECPNWQVNILMSLEQQECVKNVVIKVRPEACKKDAVIK